MSKALDKFKVGPFKVEINYDQDQPNPCTDQDGLGTVRSFSNRHMSHIDPDEAKELMESDPDIVPLAYFEHGNCMWMVSEGPHPAGVEFQWDGRRFAGIWIPDDCVRESYTGQDGKSRREWMIDQAASCCEVYTQWCNGEIYYYTIKDEDGELVDSLSGCYGFDYCREEAEEAAKLALDNRQRERKKIDNMLHL